MRFALLIFIILLQVDCKTYAESVSASTIVIDKPEIKSITLPLGWKKSSAHSIHNNICDLYWLEPKESLPQGTKTTMPTSGVPGDDYELQCSDNRNDAYGLTIRYRDLTCNEVEKLKKVISESPHVLKLTELNGTPLYWLDHIESKNIEVKTTQLNGEQVIRSSGPCASELRVMTVHGCYPVTRQSYYMFRASDRGLLSFEFYSPSTDSNNWDKVLDSIKWH